MANDQIDNDHLDDGQFKLYAVEKKTTAAGERPICVVCVDVCGLWKYIHVEWNLTDPLKWKCANFIAGNLDSILKCASFACRNFCPSVNCCNFTIFIRNS